MSFCILIPTINRKDLLLKALEHYTTNMPNTDIFVWDNGNQGIPAMPRLETAVVFKNYGVAASWNRLINLAHSKGHENFLILNDDVIYQQGEDNINKMLARGDSNTFHRCRPFYNWSAFLLRYAIYQKVGRFDERFERCYFEDNDYEYRLKLAGINISFEDGLNPDVYLNSQTIQKEPFLNNFINNRELFINKWGGLPGAETYKTPFNK